MPIVAFPCTFSAGQNLRQIVARQIHHTVHPPGATQKNNSSMRSLSKRMLPFQASIIAQAHARAECGCAQALAG